MAWRARSPDLAHRIEVRVDGDAERALLDGIEGARYAAIGAGAVVFTEAGATFYAARDASGRWRVVGPDGEGPTFMEIALPLRAIEEQPLYIAAEPDGWRVVRGDEIGPAFSGVPTDLTVLAGPDLAGAEEGGGARFGYVARDAAGARWMWGALAGPGFDAIDLVRVGDGRVLYAGTREQGTREQGTYVVSSSPSESMLGDAHESVLELASAAHGLGYAALLGTGDHTEFLHAPEGHEQILASAPLLTHLRISDDGMHAACLSTAVDGHSIDVLLDGMSVAHHRRVDGEHLTFVPTSGQLVWVAEDAQGLVVHVLDPHGAESSSERFEAIDGPFVAARTVGFIGHRGGRAEVWIDGVRVADEGYAAQLRVGPDGRYAFMMREHGERFVITRRGRWPIPRFFIDTLTIDGSGEHWAALVPDAAERVLSVWIDGEPHIEVPAEEVLEPALAMGIDPALALRAMVRGVLAARFRAAG